VGNQYNLKPEPVAASSMEKMFWQFYQLVSCQRVCVERFGCILAICFLRSLMAEQITEARSMGLTVNSLPEASLGDVGAGKFQLLFSSVFSCAVSVSLEFSVIFLLSKYTAQIADIPRAGIANAI